MEKTERAKIFHHFLREEGYAPKFDDDGDIVFKVEGRTYLVLFDDDENFFNLVFPSFWSIESESERKLVEKAALKATAQTKVAKVYIMGDNTWSSVEMFADIENAKKHFSRSISAIRAAVQVFAEQMKSS